MKNTEIINLLKKYYNFLVEKDFNFKDIESENYGLYAKLISTNVGIYFTLEYRDFMPRIQISKLETEELIPRVGLYTLKELYKNQDFILKSFYLDEIIKFKINKDYKICFRDAETFEDSIKISSELIKEYAIDFINGAEDSYIEMNKLLKIEVNKFDL